jgi:serine/threonine-protein kinase RIM15
VLERTTKKQMVWPQIGTEEGEITPEAYDFMNKLLELDPKKRLGDKGIEEIKNHPFFHGINWDKLMEEPVLFVP